MFLRKPVARKKGKRKARSKKDEDSYSSDDDKDTKKDKNEDFCYVCNEDDAMLLCCDNCPKSVHLYCLRPPLLEIPEGDFLCQECGEKQSIVYNSANSSPENEKKSKTLTSTDLNKLKSLVNKLVKLPEALPFATPVNLKEVPKYGKVIKDPMDFSTVSEKITTGKYSDLQDFVSDIYQIEANCIHFNGPNHQYTQDLKIINQSFVKMMLSFFGEDPGTIATRKRKRESESEDGRETKSAKTSVTSTPQKSTTPDSPTQASSQLKSQASALDFLQHQNSIAMKQIIGAELRQLGNSVNNNATTTTKVTTTPTTATATTGGPTTSSSSSCNQFTVKARVNSLQSLKTYIKDTFGLDDTAYLVHYTDNDGQQIDILNEECFSLFLSETTSKHLNVVLKPELQQPVTTSPISTRPR